METELRNCPECQADLRGEEIPPESLAKGYYGPWDGVTKQYYSRVIGVEIQGVYDGILYWSCPFCGGRWHRFPEGHRLHTRAEQYIKQPDRDTVLT